jgi:hypothetical protein
VKWRLLTCEQEEATSFGNVVLTLKEHFDCNFESKAFFKTDLINNDSEYIDLAHLANAVLCMARRQYHEAEFHLKAIASYSQESSVSWFSNSAKILLGLYWEKLSISDFKINWYTDLSNDAEEFHFDGLVSLIIAISMTKLPQITTPHHWFTSSVR